MQPRVIASSTSVRHLLLLRQCCALCSTKSTSSVAHRSIEHSNDAELALASKSHSLWQKLAYLKPDSPPGARLLKVAILGPTGVGKSSLVNMLSCYRSCAVSQKINTTRSKQAVVSTRGNTQLVFVDLPGLLSEQRRIKFNLENYIMRDVHSAVFQADLILVMADVSHRPSRERIDPEVLKALHYFADKPSVLVLNKVDALRGSRVKLLDTVRTLTDGFVAGRVSHVDRYASRIAAIDDATRQLLAEEGRARLTDGDADAKHELSASSSSSNWHGLWDRRWERHLVPSVSELQRHLVPPPDVLMWGANPPAPTNPVLLPTTTTAHRGLELLATPEELDRQDEARLLAAAAESGSSADALASSEDKDSKQLASKLDPFALWLRDQMLLGSVTKAEALERRRRWREIARLVAGQTAWRGFQEAFMVSAATGDGVDALRDYLASIALPGEWLFHSSCLSDMEPLDLVRMCVWARCLDRLPREVPYRLKFELLDMDRSRDGRVFISVRILCASLRALAAVIGQDGATIKAIASESKAELQDIFRANVTLKLEAARTTVPGGHLSLMKKAKSFSQLFPEVAH